MDKRYQVFVSSTYTDLREERQLVTQTLMKMDCIPAGMELFPASDEDQFEFIKRVIDDCDYYLLIIGGRYGSVTSEGISYTEKEYDYAVKKGLKVVALLHKNPEEIPSGKSELTPEARERLAAFRDKVSNGRLVDFWTDASGLPGQVALSMINAIKTFPMVGWIRADKVTNEDTLRELNHLQKENSELKDQLLETAASAVVEDIAPIEDRMELHGTRKFIEGFDGEAMPRYAEEEWGESTTWEQLFKQIAPYLTTPQDDGDVEKIIVRGCVEGANIDEFSVDNQLLQTIKIQLEAHNLIDLDTDQYGRWMLTPNGKKLMVNLRVIKRRKVAPHVDTRSVKYTESSDN